jgi:signal transduction histidine kinase
LPQTAAQKREFLNHILKAGRHLLALINEILDLARIGSGGVTLSVEPASIT